MSKCVIAIATAVLLLAATVAEAGGGYHHRGPYRSGYYRVGGGWGWGGGWGYRGGWGYGWGGGAPLYPGVFVAAFHLDLHRMHLLVQVGHGVDHGLVSDFSAVLGLRKNAGARPYFFDGQGPLLGVNQGACGEAGLVDHFADLFGVVYPHTERPHEVSVEILDLNVVNNTFAN